MTPLQRPLAAYVDATAPLAIAIGEEPAGTAVQQRLGAFPYLLSSNLLEAELRAALKREGIDFDISSLSGVNWVFPNRRLDAEIAATLEFANLSPVRVWHLATAMFFRETLQSELAFITLDEEQETVASELGFWIP